MNIIFLTTLDPNDINSWSGTTNHIYLALCAKHNVKIMGEQMIAQLSCYSRANLSEKISVDHYSPVLGKLCTEQINRLVDCDLIFFGDIYLLPSLKVDIPIVHLSDVSYHLFKDYLNKKDEEQNSRIEKIEKELLNRYNTIIYSSEWIKRNTVTHYNVDPDKIHVVEFGANIPTPNDYIVNIDTNVCNLVFIGKNWKKKGGDKMLTAYRILKSRGFSCTLTIIGATPNVLTGEDVDLTVFPFLDKSRPEHLSKLCSILKNAHFLVLPTEFDAYGIVFCEASAYAVPCIAANIGGVSQPICEGKNGYLLPSSATAEDYAEKIQTVFNDKDRYLKLRASARCEFETRLNWNVWGEKVNNILEETVLNYKKNNERRL